MLHSLIEKLSLLPQFLNGVCQGDNLLNAFDLSQNGKSNAIRAKLRQSDHFNYNITNAYIRKF